MTAPTVKVVGIAPNPNDAILQIAGNEGKLQFANTALAETALIKSDSFLDNTTFTARNLALTSNFGTVVMESKTNTDIHSQDGSVTIKSNSNGAALLQMNADGNALSSVFIRSEGTGTFLTNTQVDIESQGNNGIVNITASGDNGIVNIQAGAGINMPTLTSAVKADTLYYDSVTKAVSYGSATAGPSISFAAGNEPYATGLITSEINTTETRVYQIDSVTSTATTKFLIMANVAFKSGGHNVQMTVGRATLSGAAAAVSTNIVSDISPVALPTSQNPTYYMGATHEGVSNYTSISGHAIDTPGAGTFYYTIWMSSSTLHTYTGMTVALTALKILP
jgi:hypothetical protein